MIWKGSKYPQHKQTNNINSRNLYFLVPCRLTDLVQDIVVGQFDSNAFVKACIVGVSF